MDMFLSELNNIASLVYAHAVLAECLFISMLLYLHSEDEEALLHVCLVTALLYPLININIDANDVCQEGRRRSFGSVVSCMCFCQ